MKYSLFALLFFLNLPIFGQKGIKFNTASTLEELKIKAKKENKLIFIDVYTTWCGPCQYLSKEVFTDSKVASYFNEHFINAKVDAEDEEEGTKIAEMYGVQCYPNLLFIDATGKLVHRFAGADGTTEDFIELGRTAYDPKRRFEALEANYRRDPKDKSYALAYLTAAVKSCVDVQLALNDYLKNADYLDTENWLLIQESINDFDHPITQYVIEHLKDFEEKFPEDIGSFIYNNIEVKASEILYAEHFDSSAYHAFLEQVKRIDLKEIRDLVLFLSIEEYKQQEHWEDLAVFLSRNKQTLRDEDILNLSYEIVKNIDHSGCLSLAQVWMEELGKGVDGNTWQVQYVLALVYQKQEKVKEAIQVAEHALEIATSEKASELCQALLKELKNRKQ